MRFKLFRSRRRFVVLMILLVGSILAYIILRPHPKEDLTLNLAPATPAERNEFRKKSLDSLAVAIRSSYKLHGQYPFKIPKTETGICSGSSVHCKQVKLLDLSQILSDGLIAAIPHDPVGGTGQYNSGYSLKKDIDGSIILLAPRTENSTPLFVRL